MVFPTPVVMIYVINLNRGRSSQNWDNSAEFNSAGSCIWTGSSAQQGGQCNCASEVKLGISFGIDTSGLIKWNGFQIQKQFVKGLVNQGSNNVSRIGFFMFAT